MIKNILPVLIGESFGLKVEYNTGNYLLTDEYCNVLPSNVQKSTFYESDCLRILPEAIKEMAIKLKEQGYETF